VPAGLPPAEEAAVAGAIKDSFVDGYRWTMALAGLLAALSAVVAAFTLGRKQQQDAKS
jgi:hypothetical protein